MYSLQTSKIKPTICTPSLGAIVENYLTCGTEAKNDFTENRAYVSNSKMNLTFEQKDLRTTLVSIGYIPLSLGV